MRKSVKIPEDLQRLTRGELIVLVGALRQVLAAQQERIKELETEGRKAKRQAAPFARDKDKKRRKRGPGRKPGEGKFDKREPPGADQITDVVDVPAPEGCPDCGGTIAFDHIEDAWITDLPEPKPRVTHFRSSVCKCTKCGRGDIRGRHPDLAPDQRGATAHRVGEGVFIVAHALHYGLGVPVRKTPTILRELAGVEVSQSAITQDALRRAEQPGPLAAYQKLRDAIGQAPIAQTDDTGYRVGGVAAQLMVFATPDTADGPGITAYQIRPQHRNEEVREVIPGDFKGVMATDRGRAYDAKEFDDVNQQKCIFHVGRSVDEVLKTKTNAARDFGEKLLQLLQQALAHWQRWHDGKRRGWTQRAARIQRRITEHLRERDFTDPDNQRLLNELGWHDARGNLTRFLSDPNVPPTNNLSERELRLAIQARKVSHCVKNERGARSHEVFSSIIRTEQRKKPRSLVAALRPLLSRQPKSPGPAPPVAP